MPRSWTLVGYRNTSKNPLAIGNRHSWTKLQEQQIREKVANLAKKNFLDEKLRRNIRSLAMWTAKAMTSSRPLKLNREMQMKQNQEGFQTWEETLVPAGTKEKSSTWDLHASTGCWQYAERKFGNLFSNLLARFLFLVSSSQVHGSFSRDCWGRSVLGK